MAKSFKAQRAIIKRLEEQIGQKISQVDAINSRLCGNQYSASGDSLTGLLINGCRQLDLSPLAELTELKELRLLDGKCSDLAPLANLTQLTTLYLISDQISDLAPLANLTQLTTLDLCMNQICDAAPLANLTQLTWLDLSYNQISDLAPLASLTRLTWLDLRDNPLPESVQKLGRNNQLQYVHSLVPRFTNSTTMLLSYS